MERIQGVSRQAIPISGATGIQEIERLVNTAPLRPKPPPPGDGSATYDIIPEYIAHIREFADIRRPLRVAIDFANAMGLYEGKVLDGLLEIDPLFETLDGTFPNHEANPLKLGDPRAASE
jgi:phosphomannomutase